jgi:hypothetical protein
MDERYVVKSEVTLGGLFIFVVFDTKTNKPVRQYQGTGAMIDPACQDAFALAYEMNNCED